MNKHQDQFGRYRRRTSAGAAAAQRGFDYQLDVSVLAAISLLIISNVSKSVTLEPVSEEDIEAALSVDEPSRVVQRVNIAGQQKLIIQIKLKNDNPWSVADFARLLNHGVDRQPARVHLKDELVRYLLVTNADCSGVARTLAVTGFLERPDPADFPPSLRRMLTHVPEGSAHFYC